MKNTIFGLVGVAAIALLLFWGLSKPEAPKVVTVDHPAPPTGAITGPDSPYPYSGVNGVRYWPVRNNLTTATSTICALQSPAATSTLAKDVSGILFTNASTTAGRYQMWRSTSQYSTTTSGFITGKLATQYIDSMMATTGPAGVDATTGVGGNSSVTATNVFPPNSWLVFTVESFALSQGISFAQGGCQAVFVTGLTQ